MAWGDILQTKQAHVPGHTQPQLVIAVEGAIEDWTSYYGPLYHKAEVIRDSGTKLPKALACQIFPILNPARYRH